jgi:hypothetical protein
MFTQLGPQKVVFVGDQRLLRQRMPVMSGRTLVLPFSEPVQPGMEEIEMMKHRSLDLFDTRDRSQIDLKETQK